jgi:cobalt-zinc-cadmium efflux system membrane fusion protein
MTRSETARKISPGLRSGLVLALLLVGAVLGAAGYRFINERFLNPPAAAPTETESVPPLVREGQRIVVPEGSPLRAKLTIEAVTTKEVQRNLTLPAAVEADPARLVKVLPPLAGRITQLKVQLGEEVGSGQPLAILDSPDLGTAYADYDRAKANLALTIKSRDRLRELVKSNAIAIKELQQAETDYLTAEAEKQRAEARLRQIGVDPEVPSKTRTVTIAAPVAGSLIDLAVAPGAYWNDATAPLMTVADLSTIWVTANVPEKDTARVAKGQPVDIVFPAYPGEMFRGKVLFVSNVLDPDTRRTKVRIALPNPNVRFKPGMFANVTFFAPKQTVVAVPTTALVLKDDLSQVYLEVASWTFEARPVEVGFQQGNDVIVRGGLKAGDRVVVKGGVLLND